MSYDNFMPGWPRLQSSSTVHCSLAQLSLVPGHTVLDCIQEAKKGLRTILSQEPWPRYAFGRVLTFVLNLLRNDRRLCTTIHLFVSQKGEFLAEIGVPELVLAVVHRALKGLAFPAEYVVPVLPESSAESREVASQILRKSEDEV